MRKILSGLLATSMVVAMASTMVSAAVVKPSIDVTMAAIAVGGTNGTLDIVKGIVGAGSGGGATSSTITGVQEWKAAVELKNVSLTFGALGGKINLPDVIVEGKGAVAGADNGTDTILDVTYSLIAISPADIAKKYDGHKFSTMLDGRVYTGTLVASGNNLKIMFNENAKINGLAAATIAATASLKGDPTTTATLTVTASGAVSELSAAQRPSAADAGLNVVGGAYATSANTNVTPGTGSENADVDKSGYFDNKTLKDVIICDGNGNPIAMTEKGAGVDKDLNGVDGVQSSKTLYFMINDTVEPTFADDNYWKVKVSKGDNAKIVKAVTDTTKIFNTPLVRVDGRGSVNGIDFSKRHRYIKVELAEIFTDDEYKVTLDLRLSTTSKVETKLGITSGEIKVKDFAFWVKNIVKDADGDWKVGIGGLMLNPLKNDWNEVTYMDENHDVAFMKFFGDSDTSKFYAKLSTKWTHDDYAAYFNDQDAYFFEFTGSPKMSSTSRADLQIYNPFINEDGNETIDPTTATIYQIIDGDLVDVTSSFTYGEGNNGDNAFITRTRFLGSYIICEKPVQEAVGDSNIDDLMPDDMEVPNDIAPDTGAGGNAGGNKQPANTGRYN